jgi:hypothetical protein
VAETDTRKFNQVVFVSRHDVPPSGSHLETVIINDGHSVDNKVATPRLFWISRCVGARPCRAESGRYGLMRDMKKDDVKAVLGRVLTWPAPAQEEAVASLRAIEDEWMDSFELSSDDREALERSADDVREAAWRTTTKSGRCSVATGAHEGSIHRHRAR